MKIQHIDKQIYELLEADGPSDPGRRKFLQKTAGAAAMAAAPKQTLGAIGKISQQAASVAKAASTNATLRALGAAAVQAVIAHHEEFGGEIGPINYDDDYDDDDEIPGYWDGTGADWDPSVDPTESPWGPSLVKQTVSGRTFIEIETGFSGEDIILTFLNDKGRPSWVRVEHMGEGQLSVNDLNVPGMKKVSPHYISDIIEFGFDKGMSTDPDEPKKYSNKFKFPSRIRDGKEYEFLIDLLASGATSNNSGLKFAKKNPKWVEIASQYPYYDNDDDDYNDDNTAKSAVTDVAKSAATSGVRTQTIAGGLTAFKELVNRVLDKVNIDRKKDKPTMKDMGRIKPISSVPALPAPKKSDVDFMKDLRNIINQPIQDIDKARDSVVGKIGDVERVLKSPERALDKSAAGLAKGLQSIVDQPIQDIDKARDSIVGKLSNVERVLKSPEQALNNLEKIMQNIVDRPLTDQEKEIVQQELKKEKND